MEYDAAKERGEVAGHGGDRKSRRSSWKALNLDTPGIQGFGNLTMM
jgi:hypothetical protein